MKRKPLTRAQLERLRAEIGPLRNFFEEWGRIGGKMGRDARWAKIHESTRSRMMRELARKRWAKAREKGSS